MRTIDWVSLNDHVCHLEIDDESNTTTAMTAGARPFVTQMDESDEIFKNIRTCTGNIGVVVDSVDEIVDLVGRTPISTPVTLTVDDVVRWVGFLSCESFSQEWDRGPLEIDLPVMSGLEVLNGIRYPYTQLSDLGYISFAQFLLNLNTALGGIYTNFYFPKVSNTTTTLTYIFRMSNYATPDDKNTTYEMATYYDILDDICKLFGWQAIEYEQSLVFLCADIKLTSNNSIMDGYTVAQLTSLAGGTAVTPSEPTCRTVIPEFYGVDHRRSFVAGKNKVDVVGELNPIPGNLWEMNVREQCVNQSFKMTGLSLHVFYISYGFGTYQSEDSSYPNGNIRVRNSLADGVDVENGYNVKYQNYFNHNENAYGGSVVYEKFYNFQTGEGDDGFTMRLIAKAQNTTPYVTHSIHTNFYYTPSQNSGDRFYFSGKIETAATAGSYFSTPNGVVYLRVGIRIGELYFDGDGWVTDSVSCIVESRDGKFNRYGKLDNGNVDWTDYIPAPNTSGEIVIQLLATTTTTYGPGDVYVAYEDLSISLLSTALGWMIKTVGVGKIEVNEDKESLNNGFSDEFSETCGLTLARGSVSGCNGVVLTSSKTRPASLYASKYPEKALCDRVATYAAQARMMLSAVVKADGAMLSPFVKYAMRLGGRPWVLLAQTIDWNNEECVASFFEPSYNS